MTMNAHRLRRTAGRRERRWRINWQAIVGVLLIVAAAYLAGSTYRLGEENQRRSECQTSLNRGFLVSLQARDVAARESSEAQRLLLSTPPDASEKEKKAARDRYVSALSELDQARATNPLPQVTAC